MANEDFLIEDFLFSTVTDVHFGGNIFVRVTVNLGNDVSVTNATFPPGPPSTPVGKVSAAGASKLIDTKDTKSKVDNTSDNYYVYPPYQIGAAAGGFHFNPADGSETPIPGPIGYPSLAAALKNEGVNGPGTSKGGTTNGILGFVISSLMDMSKTGVWTGVFTPAKPGGPITTEAQAQSIAAQAAAQAYAIKVTGFLGGGQEIEEWFATVTYGKLSNYNFQRGDTVVSTLVVQPDNRSCAVASVNGVDTPSSTEDVLAQVQVELFYTDANGKPISKKIASNDDLNWQANQTASGPGNQGPNGTYAFAVKQTGKTYTLVVPPGFTITNRG